MIGKRINLLRKSAKLNQTEFGNLFGVSKQCVSNWETNTIPPSAEKIKDMAVYFKVTTDFIYGLDNDQKLDVSGIPPEEVGHIQFFINVLSNKNGRK